MLCPVFLAIPQLTKLLPQLQFVRIGADANDFVSAGVLGAQRCRQPNGAQAPNRYRRALEHLGGFDSCPVAGAHCTADRT